MSFYFREKPQFGERFREKFGDDIFKELKQEFGDDADFFADRPQTQSTTPEQQQQQQHRQRKSSQPSSAAHNPMRSAFDRSFPRGFPFDDEGFGHHRRGNNIRTHLDDLAARHPEFADQLLGPPWADIPFNTNSLHRNRNGSVRRGSQERANNQSDEDARSQASGSSAASGASGVSSHNGSETEQKQQTQPSTMENPARNVRAMSAPPDNRQNVPQSNGSPFVAANASQKMNDQPQQNGQREKSPPSSQQQKPQSPQPQQTGGGNVRHIPIFVEGRDRPVLPKDVDEPDFARPQTREQHRESPVHFQRPSHYQQHYKPSSAWHFQDPFFDQPARSWGSPPTSSPLYSRFGAQEKPHHQQTRHTEQTIPTQRHQQAHQQQPHHPQQPHQQKPHQQTEVPQAEPPKPRQQVQPKDPLEKVALVQKEVDELTEQVKQYSGNSRQDKQYMYLDEMLTRELIKLDDIETEGKDNVRQARKQAIKSIQESIALLESKAPLPGQPENNEVAPENESMATDENSEEKMETNEVQTDVAPAATAAATEEPKAVAIPLPDVPVPEEPKAPAIPMPAPESPVKAASVEAPTEKVEESKETAEQTLIKAEDKMSEEKTGGAPEELSGEPTTKVSQFFLTINEPAEDINKAVVEPVAETVAESVDSNDKNKAVEETTNAPAKMEDRQSSPVKELVIESPKKKKTTKVSKHPKEEPKTETKTEATATTPAKETKQVKTKKEAPPVPEKPEKSPKKAKKTKDTKKEPEPVSVTAIPLPAPGQNI
uniref:BAG domain-containing protein n=1 Tax=Trichogramma kaykai TaxID=54128 RepID=A0ABD2VUT2_9HYME